MHSATIKFRRPTIGQNGSAMCTNKGGHRDTFSNEQREAPRVSRGLLSMQATYHRASSKARDEVCSLSQSGGIDLMFEQSENVASKRAWGRG